VAESEQSRQVALALLDPGGARSGSPEALSSSFRCWTPSDDWTRGDAALDSLRRAVADFLARAGRDELLPDAVVAGPTAVVVEATASRDRGAPSITFVVGLDAESRVGEVCCYFDPRPGRDQH